MLVHPLTLAVRSGTSFSLYYDGESLKYLFQDKLFKFEAGIKKKFFEYVLK